jgi:hypothetical protein
MRKQWATVVQNVERRRRDTPSHQSNTEGPTGRIGRATEVGCSPWLHAVPIRHFAVPSRAGVIPPTSSNQGAASTVSRKPMAFVTATSVDSRGLPFADKRLTSKKILRQTLYNHHIHAPSASAGNNGLITPAESALTKNMPATPLESALPKKWGGSCFQLESTALCRSRTRRNRRNPNPLMRFSTLSCTTGVGGTSFFARFKPSNFQTFQRPLCGKVCSHIETPGVYAHKGGPPAPNQGGVCS